MAEDINEEHPGFDDFLAEDNSLESVQLLLKNTLMIGKISKNNADCSIKKTKK